MKKTEDIFRGNQLRIARLARGLSLEILAQNVGATRQYIHQIEAGQRYPSADLVAAFSADLGIRETFFYSALNSPIDTEACHFRKQLTTPATITNQVIARATILDDFISNLNSIVEFPEVNFPDFPARTLLEAEKSAELAREYWDLGKASPIRNMVRVVESAGAIVTSFNGLSERVDALSIDRPRPIIIRNTAKLSLCRQRFDIAHECGHLVIHKGIATGSKEIEDQAHRFASAFLLPRSAFIHEFPVRKRIIWDELASLKLRWKVSLRAIIRRAFDLNLLNAAQYRSANIHLVKTGQMRTELYDDVLELEHPEVLESAIRAIYLSGPAVRAKFESMNTLTPETLSLIAPVGQPDTSKEKPGENIIAFPSRQS